MSHHPITVAPSHLCSSWHLIGVTSSTSSSLSVLSKYPPEKRWSPRKIWNMTDWLNIKRICKQQRIIEACNLLPLQIYSRPWGPTLQLSLTQKMRWRLGETLPCPRKTTPITYLHPPLGASGVVQKYAVSNSIHWFLHIFVEMLKCHQPITYMFRLPPSSPWNTP